MNEIKKGYSHIVINYSMYSKDFRINYKDKFFSPPKNMIYNSPNKVLKDFSITLGYTSCVILKRKLFLKTPFEIYNNMVQYGTSFNYAVYYSTQIECNLKYVVNSLIKYRGFNVPEFQNTLQWYKFFATGANILFEKLSTMGYVNSAISSAKNIVLIQYIMHDISFRKRNREKLTGIFKLIYPCYKKQYLFWIVIMPMIFAPGYLVTIVNQIVLNYRKFKNIILQII